MSALDWVLSTIGLAGLIAFVGIIGAYVAEPDLLTVIGIAVLMAVYDFWIRPLIRRR